MDDSESEEAESRSGYQSLIKISVEKDSGSIDDSVLALRSHVSGSLHLDADFHLQNINRKHPKANNNWDVTSN